MEDLNSGYLPPVLIVYQRPNDFVVIMLNGNHHAVSPSGILIAQNVLTLSQSFGGKEYFYNMHISRFTGFEKGSERDCI